MITRKWLCGKDKEIGGGVEERLTVKEKRSTLNYEPKDMKKKGKSDLVSIGTTGTGSEGEDAEQQCHFEVGVG